MVLTVQSCMQMLRIRRSEESGGTIEFALSGRIEEQHVSELQTCLAAESEDAEITLDLQEVRLVDREVVRFLADCETRGIKLRNCPSYVREWMETGGYTS
jgi:anti-anti-sigma regulatory factor